MALHTVYTPMLWTLCPFHGHEPSNSDHAKLRRVQAESVEEWWYWGWCVKRKWNGSDYVYDSLLNWTTLRLCDGRRLSSVLNLREPLNHACFLYNNHHSNSLVMVDNLKFVFLRSEKGYFTWWMDDCTCECKHLWVTRNYNNLELRTVPIPWRWYEQESSLSAKLNRVVTVWRSPCEGDAKSGWPKDWRDR